MEKLDFLAVNVSSSVKAAHKAIEEYCEAAGDDEELQGVKRAMSALHEKVRRYGSKHHSDVVMRGGDT